MTISSEVKTYTGGCHCGAMRYEVTMALGEAIDCNCSICTKHGILWAYATSADFKLLSGADALTEYRFGSRAIRHVFCARCGVESFADGTEPDGKETVGINLRCLDGIDIATLTIKHFDGRSL